MRVEPTFDPDAHDYGPATAAVREILHAWAAIDWFVPTAHGDAVGIAALREHTARARVVAPDLFPERVEVSVHPGGPAELATWCERVRTQTGWDWKYGALKPLGKRHAGAHGWTADREAAERGYTPGDHGPHRLFLVMPDGTAIWTLNPGSLPAPCDRDAAYYFEWARLDTYSCIEWQLAERSADLATNPFWPLLQCYAAGFYPFSLARDRVVLFRFA